MQVGEAYDKVARLLNLSYPGGPIIDNLAQSGDAQRFKIPRPLSMKNSKTKIENRFNFSFSGIKTAVYYLVKGKSFSKKDICDLCASFQQAVVEVLIEKTLDACNEFKAKTIVLGGGVACNSALRKKIVKSGEKRKEKSYFKPNANIVRIMQQ